MIFKPVVPAGKIGEHPIGIPNNLMPYIQQVVLGQREFLSVYGSDYKTKDGTCVRDYIHVMDLADGHVKAVDKLFTTKEIGCVAYNLGTGNGSTVLEMIKVSQSATLGSMVLDDDCMAAKEVQKGSKFSCNRILLAVKPCSLTQQ